jgi:hypothetical protein
MLGQKRIESALVAVFQQGRVRLPVAVPKVRVRAPVKVATPIVRAATCLSSAACHLCAVKDSPPNQVDFNEVNLDQLSQAFKADADVTPESLAEGACCVTHATRWLCSAAVK